MAITSTFRRQKTKPIQSQMPAFGRKLKTRIPVGALHFLRKQESGFPNVPGLRIMWNDNGVKGN
jgi:hypothetical protein